MKDLEELKKINTEQMEKLKKVNKDRRIVLLKKLFSKKKIEKGYFEQQYGRIQKELMG